jgi:hypothetical protein
MDHVVLHCVKLGRELQLWNGNFTDSHMFSWLATSCTPTILQIILDFIMVERHTTVNELQCGTGTDQATLHNIICKEFKTKKVCALWVPPHLM